MPVLTARTCITRGFGASKANLWFVLVLVRATTNVLTNPLTSLLICTFGAFKSWTKLCFVSPLWCTYKSLICKCITNLKRFVSLLCTGPQRASVHPKQILQSKALYYISASEILQSKTKICTCKKVHSLYLQIVFHPRNIVCRTKLVQNLQSGPLWATHKGLTKQSLVKGLYVQKKAR